MQIKMAEPYGSLEEKKIDIKKYIELSCFENTGKFKQANYF